MCFCAHTTDSMYQVCWNGSNRIEIRIANHNANNDNYSSIQLANQPVSIIFEFVFENTDRTLPPQTIPYNVVINGNIEQRSAKLYINQYNRNHLDVQKDMIAIVDSMADLVSGNNFYEHPFSTNENIKRVILKESQLRSIICKTIRKILQNK